MTVASFLSVCGILPPPSCQLLLILQLVSRGVPLPPGSLSGCSQLGGVPLTLYDLAVPISLSFLEQAFLSPPPLPPLTSGTLLTALPGWNAASAYFPSFETVQRHLLQGAFSDRASLAPGASVHQATSCHRPARR